MLAGAEMERQDPETHAKIVHFTVEHSKKFVSEAEIGFLNALLRKLPGAMAKINRRALAAHHSHPDWLVEHWLTEWGELSTAKLLHWNQQIPCNYIKLETTIEQISPKLQTTQWPKFYKVAPKTNWSASIVPLLNRGIAYIKDPSTRLAAELLAPIAGEPVLDLCAAPGGKAFDIAQQMKGQGLLVAVDLPGNRIPQLKENLAQITQAAFQTAVLEKDVLKLQPADFSDRGLPSAYPAVMLDAPCSNTGVIQRRIDVKWRLQARDISSCAELQLHLLQKAAGFVAKAGRLVYSTCSIELTENIAVVQKFLDSPAGAEFELSDERISLPWETGHDGAGAFLLKRH
jgi:16S rRNA (cytosine967-C5)-methyltransferase